jgi:PPM family protein phosphatase
VTEPLHVVEFASASDTGLVRRANEDAHLTRPPVFVVADGMGGARAGERAARIAVETFERLGSDGPPEDLLRRTAGEANQRIHDAAASDADAAGMGTTLIASVVTGNAISFGHVGDSRAYLWRDGALQQLSDDHSLVGELIRRGALTAEEAQHHPQRSIITRALGTEAAVEVDTWTIEARDADVVLLCSDGLSGMLRDDEIGRVIAAAPTLGLAARELVLAANAAGGEDNVTAVLFRIGTGPAATASTTIETAGRPALVYVDQDPSRRGRRGLRRLLFVASALVVGGALAFGGIAALRQSHFVGATDDGRIAIYQGLPFDVVADVRLYRRVRTSAVPVAALSAAERAALFDHTILSLDAAQRRVDRLPAAPYFRSDR